MCNASLCENDFYFSLSLFFLFLFFLFYMLEQSPFGSFLFPPFGFKFESALFSSSFCCSNLSANPFNQVLSYITPGYFLWWTRRKTLRIFFFFSFFFTSFPSIQRKEICQSGGKFIKIPLNPEWPRSFVREVIWRSLYKKKIRYITFEWYFRRSHFYIPFSGFTFLKMEAMMNWETRL